MVANPQSKENQQNLIYFCGVNAKEDGRCPGYFSEQYPKCEFKKTFGRSESIGKVSLDEIRKGTHQIGLQQQ